MRDISDLTLQTTFYELACHLADKVAANEINTFSGLKNYIKIIPYSRSKREVISRTFDLIRKMHWGLFSHLHPKTYPKLWERLVIQDTVYPFAGNLKRNMTITEIFVGLLDIHGYTHFCERNRHNLSMLELLDEVLQNDITSISASCGVLSRRCRGDEVILIGATAKDVLEATLNIASYFSRRQILKKEKVEKRRPGYKVILPDLFLSAGIAGGQKYTPLVITQDGDISGSVVNEAARIQTRANKLAPDSNKILISNHVHASITRNHAIDDLSESIGQEIQFFNSGAVEFKGTSVFIYDVIFCEAERFRVQYADSLALLFDSISKRLWNKGIFINMLEAIKAMSESMPDFSLKSKEMQKNITNVGLSKWCDIIARRFLNDDYEGAIDEFGTLSDLLGALPNVDPLIAEYAWQARLRYQAIIDDYRLELDNLIASHPEAILTPNERDTYLKAQQHYAMFERIRIHTRGKERQRKQLWQRVIENAKSRLDLQIQSLKE